MIALPTSAAETDTLSRRRLLCLQKGLGHDLANQLVALQGLLRLLELEGGGQFGGDAQEYVTRMKAALTRLSERIRLLNLLARPTPPEIATSESATAEVIQEAQTAVQLLFPRRAIEYHGATLVSRLRIDRLDLRNLLVQLFINAVASVDAARMALITVDTAETVTAHELRIGDNGSGLDCDRLDRLRGFLRAESGEGFENGLGLLVVREIMVGCAGEILVESQPGAGCMFTLVFPKPPCPNVVNHLA